MASNGELGRKSFEDSYPLSPTQESKSIESLTALGANTTIRQRTENADEGVGKSPPLSAEEREQILVSWNATEKPFPQDRCVHELFEEQVGRTPEAIAAVFEDNALTYRELNQRANAVAAHLRSLGAGPESRIGICVRRSLDMLAGLLGILKSGAAYVPLDPAYPRDRLAFMLEDAQVHALLTEHGLAQTFEQSTTKIVCVEDISSGELAESHASGVTPDNLAYVIYTSGSTGKPKGVMIRHRNVVNFFAGMDDVLGTAPGVWLAVTSICFDISVLELLWTVTRGFKVVIQSGERGAKASRDYEIPEQIRRHGVTHFQCTPSLMGMLLQEPGAAPAIRAVNTVLLGGEALTAALLEQLQGTHRIVNMYGPTETTVWSTSQVVAPGEPITIGRPMANTKIYILDEFQQPTPAGVPGELHIGGAGVARGYLNRPELTAERFIPEPFAGQPGELMYRTGDLARYRPDGTIEFLGRLDHQVKLRGFRIELGEIEAALRKFPGVREAVVVVRELNANDKRLVACLVSEQPVEPAQLREALKEKLPEYMVPSIFTFLREMPLTPNGKIDRKALDSASSTAFVQMPGPNSAEGEKTETQPVSELPLTPSERHRIVVEWNNTALEFPRDARIHELFEAQTQRTPEAVAAVAGQQEITYRELNRRANQLAHYLKAVGVGPEVLVGLCVERNFALLIGALGIFKAGGAYVPLDWTYPPERVRFMLEDTQTPVLVTQQSLMQHVPKTNARVVCLDTDWEQIAAHETSNPAKVGSAENLAYVMYTSGSTGVAKGVGLEHRSAVSFIYWAREVFGPEELKGVLASTSICFDLSIFELFAPLSWGGTVILADNAVQIPPGRNITLINTVPSAIKDLLKAGTIPTSVTTVNLAGEKLATAVVKQLYERKHIRKVYDLYGPSEATTYATYALRAPDAPATVGRPLANTQVYILDPHMQPCAVGVPGEIFIGGDCLARGYINRPELTAEKFVLNPFSAEPGARLYKTGDLARYFPDGNIDFIGRRDHQVKIRGYRIELGEIEATLAQHPGVQDCVAVVREDAPEQKQIVAYIVLAPAARLTATDLRRFLRERLPDYMMPNMFVTLSALPLMPNGKVNRAALPAPSGAVTLAEEDQQVAALSPVEEALAEIWREVIGVDKVGLHDDFFDLGGHSVLVTQITSRVRQVFEVDLSMRHLFGAPTVAALARVIEQLLDEQLRQMSEAELQQLATAATREVS